MRLHWPLMSRTGRMLLLLLSLAISLALVPSLLQSMRFDGNPAATAAAETTATAAPSRGNRNVPSGVEPDAGGMAPGPDAGGVRVKRSERPGDPARLPEPSPDSELRRRLGMASGLGRRARDGDASATAEVARQLADEPDPRVRHALSTGEMPPVGRSRRAPPALPAPAASAEAGHRQLYWLTPGHHDGTYESSLTIDASGRASVETVYESDDGQRWRVRYNAWAWRDATGRLVIDARGEPVEHLERPAWGSWSPDSMVIGDDGLVELIDDKHDPGQGSGGAKAPG